MKDMFPADEKRQRELYGTVSVEQDGKDCLVTMGGKTRRIEDCDALKLANTLWNKAGEKYSMEQMHKFGFEKKLRSVS